MGRLDGKVALISGTGRGMGRTAALEFAREGARVVGCDLDLASADDTVALVREAGGEMVSIAPVDLSSQPGADAWVQLALDTRVAGVRVVVLRTGLVDALVDLQGTEHDGQHDRDEQVEQERQQRDVDLGLGAREVHQRPAEVLLDR